jgi:hypothetical protein
MKLAAVRDRQGNIRVHAATCADVNREVKKFRDGDAYTGEFASRTEFNQDWWGEVAADHYAEGTPEWEKECAVNGSMGTLFLPCCSDLPEDVEPEPTKRTAYRSLRTKTIHTHSCPAVAAMLTKATGETLPKPWAAYDPNLALEDVAAHPEWDCSRCSRIRRGEQAAARSQAKAEPQGYFSAAAKVAHTAQCPSMKAAASGKLHIPLMKTGFKALSALLRMIDTGEAKECLSCKKIRHSH